MSTNLLVLMADQHTPFVAGCYGNQVAHTPHLDRLAKIGTVFDAAYTPSPICVPARAAMATGRYVHETGNWDNAAPYTGKEAPSWGHRAAAAGAAVTTIGKLHFANADPGTGYPDQRVPLHVKNGGDLTHALRGDQPPTSQLRDIVIDAGEGESDYVAYDRRVTATATAWLRDEALRPGRPWVTVVSFASPHYPLTAPTEHYRRFDHDALTLPASWRPENWDQHERTAGYRASLRFDDPITEARARRAAAAYYGLVSFMDEQIGRILEALDESGEAGNTAVLYLSDHGELLGAHGLWFKGTMHEGSVRVPAVLAGPGVPAGARRGTAVSLLDVYPTVVDILGLAPDTADEQLPGRSLRALAAAPDDPQRPVFSEYHSAFSPHGISMVRWDRWKYVHHVGAPPQLFDLAEDPGELSDLAAQAQFADVRNAGERRLRAIGDPEDIDAAARRDQRRRVAERHHELAGSATLMAFTPPPRATTEPEDKDREVTP